jgi:hypothetical protein
MCTIPWGVLVRVAGVQAGLGPSIRAWERSASLCRATTPLQGVAAQCPRHCRMALSRVRKLERIGNCLGTASEYRNHTPRQVTRLTAHAPPTCEIDADLGYAVGPGGGGVLGNGKRCGYRI